MLDVIQTLADGLLFGAIYALIGIGFTLVFGVMHKINMAYAAASLAGAYAGVVLLRLGALHPWLVIPLACVGGAALRARRLLPLLQVHSAVPSAGHADVDGRHAAADRRDRGARHRRHAGQLSHAGARHGAHGRVQPARRPASCASSWRWRPWRPCCTCSTARGWGWRRGPSRSSRWRRSCAA